MAVYDINIRPIFCPFWLHNAELEEATRFEDWFTGSANFTKHILNHIRALGHSKALCPATVSTSDGIMCNCPCLEPMDAKELEDHLGKQHVKFAIPEAKRNMTEADETSEAQSKRRNVGRRIAMQPKSLNTRVGEAMKAGQNASKGDKEIEAVDLHRTVA
jgi:hypothetical protein